MYGSKSDVSIFGYEQSAAVVLTLVEIHHTETGMIGVRLSPSVDHSGQYMLALFGRK